MNRIGPESSYGGRGRIYTVLDIASKLARTSMEVMNTFKEEPSFTINAMAAAVPEIAMVMASGGATGPQPPMLQLALHQEVKNKLRESFDDIIGPDALIRELPPQNEAARESAIKGQDSSTIGKEGNEIYGGATIKRIFGSVREKFQDQQIPLSFGDTQVLPNGRATVAVRLTDAATAAAEGLGPFKIFLDGGDAPRAAPR